MAGVVTALGAVPHQALSRDHCCELGQLLLQAVLLLQQQLRAGIQPGRGGTRRLQAKNMHTCMTAHSNLLRNSTKAGIVHDKANFPEACPLGTHPFQNHFPAQQAELRPNMQVPVVQRLA